MALSFIDNMEFHCHAEVVRFMEPLECRGALRASGVGGTLLVVWGNFIMYLVSLAEDIESK